MANLDDALLTDIAHKSDLLLSPSGDLQLISGLENLKNALFHRLMTSPGTLVYRPDYGVGIKDYQNAVSSLAIQQQLATKIQEQFEQDPRVQSVNGVALDYNDLQPEKVTINIKLDAIGYGEQVMQYTPFAEGI
jgi:phage baseplate assembly protein W